jgi:hypothetical protein
VPAGLAPTHAVSGADDVELVRVDHEAKNTIVEHESSARVEAEDIHAVADFPHDRSLAGVDSTVSHSAGLSAQFKALFQTLTNAPIPAATACAAPYMDFPAGTTGWACSTGTYAPTGVIPPGASKCRPVCTAGFAPESTSASF